MNNQQSSILINLLRHTVIIAYTALIVLAATAYVYFPVMKGRLEGFIPVVAAAGIFWAVRARRFVGVAEPVIRAVAAVSRPRFLITVCVFILIVQSSLLLITRPSPVFDGLFVLRQARDFVQTGQMPPLTYYPPIKLWWYAPFLWISGGSFLAGQLSNVLLSCLYFISSYALASCFFDERRARLFSLLSVLYPGSFFYVLTTPYYHYLYTSIMMLAAASWMKSGGQGTDRPTIGMTVNLKLFAGIMYPLLAGLLAGIGALTKAVLLIAPVQAVIYWFGVSRFRATGASGVSTNKRAEACACTLYRADSPSDWRPLSVSVLLMLLGMALVMAPWIVRNNRVFDAFVPVCTSGGLVLYSANNPDSNGLYSYIADDADIETPQQMLEHSRASSDKAKMFITEQPSAFARLVVKKFIYTWGNETTFAALMNMRGRPNALWDNGLSFLFQTGWGVLLFMSLSRMGRGVGTSGSDVCFLCALIVVTHAAVYLLYEGGARHHLPLVPFMMLFLFSEDSNSHKKHSRPTGDGLRNFGAKTERNGNNTKK